MQQWLLLAESLKSGFGDILAIGPDAPVPEQVRGCNPQVIDVFILALKGLGEAEGCPSHFQGVARRLVADGQAGPVLDSALLTLYAETA